MDAHLVNRNFFSKKVEIYHTRNITGFGLNHPIFGKIFVGHFDPIHKVPQVYSQMQIIFNKYDIIAGDINAGWHRLIKPTKYNQKPLVDPKYPDYVYNPISYLTPVQPSDPRDTRLDMIICKYEQPNPIDIGISFNDFHKYEKPRHLMKILGFPSDHRPIKTSINVELNGNNETLILAFWNVADPMYWSKIYPTANLEEYISNEYEDLDDKQEISIKKEHDRLESILRWIDYLLENCDVLGLAEVPVKLIPNLKIIAKKYNMIMEHRSEHSDLWKASELISQMVVLYR